MAIFIIGIILILIPSFTHAAVTCSSNDAAHTISLSFNDLSPNLTQTFRPNEPYLFKVQSIPSEATLTWLINGKTVKSSAPTELCYAFEHAGNYQLEITESKQSKKITTAINITSYENISLTKILPNPKGNDTNTEEVYLKNGNDFPVNLVSWHLKSKTTTTSAVITVSIPAASEAMVKLSNKLRNEDGAYDLLNESGGIVDSVAYPSTQEGVYISRVNGAWVIPKSEKPGSNASSKTETATPTPEMHATIEGKIILPEGQSFDVQTADGKTVHAVIHSSFTSEKPKFHKGDTIKVSGIWKESKNGPYLSVRDGDTLTLITSLASVPRADSSSASSKFSAVDVGGANVENPEQALDDSSAEESTHNPNRESAFIESQPTAVLAYDKSLRWLFVAIISFGAILTLPFHRQSDKQAQPLFATVLSRLKKTK